MSRDPSISFAKLGLEWLEIRARSSLSYINKPLAMFSWHPLNIPLVRSTTLDLIFVQSVKIVVGYWHLTGSTGMWSLSPAPPKAEGKDQPFSGQKNGLWKTGPASTLATLSYFTCLVLLRQPFPFSSHQYRPAVMHGLQRQLSNFFKQGSHILQICVSQTKFGSPKASGWFWMTARHLQRTCWIKCRCWDLMALGNSVAESRGTRCRIWMKKGDLQLLQLMKFEWNGFRICLTAMTRAFRKVLPSCRPPWTQVASDVASLGPAKSVPWVAEWPTPGKYGAGLSLLGGGPNRGTFTMLSIARCGSTVWRTKLNNLWRSVKLEMLLLSVTQVGFGQVPL